MTARRGAPAERRAAQLGRAAYAPGARGRPRRTVTRRAPGHVESQVSDPRLVEERRGQIVRAAVKLFAKNGYYTTTIQEIAREAGISTGLVYQYVRDKDDLLLLVLKLVLERYEHEIPQRMEQSESPLARLCAALATYCEIVDRLRDATVLTYRSTKSLREDRRALIMEGETRTNRIIEACIGDCVSSGRMREVNRHLHAYLIVMFCHAWALKHWALAGRYSLARYVREGLALLVEPFVTDRGRAEYDSARRAAAPRRVPAQRAATT